MNVKTEQGFSLVEVIIVILIISILAAFAFPVFISVQERGSITKDLSNLRQLALAAQRYINDNDGVLFSATSTSSWMKQLLPDSPATGYLSDWGIFQSPWDTRTRTTSVIPVSYGLNANAFAIDTSKISNPAAFVFFGAAQAPGSTVSFQGLATSPNPGVTVVGLGKPNSRSVPPGGIVTAGTQLARKRVSAVCADGHAESLLWTAFSATACTGSDPYGCCRWSIICTP